MTYNFDADRWYENQKVLLEQRRAQGELTEAQFEEELERLGERYDEMLQRMNGPFELPPKRTNGEG